MNPLTLNINSFLNKSRLPFKLYKEENRDVFKIGIMGEFQTMLLEIYIDNSENTYVLECSPLGFGWFSDYEDAINQFNSESQLVKANINTNRDMLIFKVVRSNITDYHEDNFISDFNMVVDACDLNTIKIHNGVKNKIIDKDISFMRDLNNVTIVKDYLVSLYIMKYLTVLLIKCA